MGNIIPFKRYSLADRKKAQALCNSGLHKWALMHDKRFDAMQGKVISLYRCDRCGTLRSIAN